MQTPAPVDYARAHSVDEALALLERHGPESRLIAGGHSLIPMMRLRIAQPECVIDINDLAELDYIRVDGNELVIGAMTRHRTVLESAVIGEHYRIFHDAERVIADPIVRNRGTVGGSLYQAGRRICRRSPHPARHPGSPVRLGYPQGTGQGVHRRPVPDCAG